MLVIIFFLLFLITLYFSGNGLFNFFLVLRNKIFKKNKIFQVDDLKFFRTSFPLIALFFIGNVSIFLNFFISINTFLSIFIILFPIFFNFYNTKDIVVNLKLKNFDINRLIFRIFTASALSLSTYSTGLAYDAGLYHLNNQYWIKSSSTVLGLSNLHIRYGYSSIIEYVSTNFWIGNNLIILHFISLVFIYVFFDYLYLLLNISKFKMQLFAIFVSIFGFLDNFGFGGGKNSFIEIQGIAKYDTSFAITFSLSAVSFLIYQKNKNYKLIFNLFLLLSVFSMQMRPTGYLLLVFWIQALLSLINQKEYLSTLKILTTYSSIIMVNTVKNIMVSSCLIFPIENLCIKSLRWYVPNSAINEQKSIKSALIGYLPFENIIIWFNRWIDKFPVNLNVSINLAFSLSLVFLLSFFLSKKTTKNNLPLVLLTSLYFLVWLTSAPDFRFFHVITILSILIISHSRKYNSKLPVSFFNVILFLSIFLMPRVDSYLKFIDEPFKQITINPPSIEYVERILGYGVEPLNDEEICWVNIECIPRYSNLVKKDNLYNKMIFISYDK